MSKSLKIALILILVAGVLAGGGALYGVNHFVLRTTHGVAILEKRFLTFQDTYMDIRNWKSVNFDTHPEIKHAMATQGYRDYLTDLKAEEYRQMAEGIASEAREKMPEWLTGVLGKTFELQDAIRNKAADWLKD